LLANFVRLLEPFMALLGIAWLVLLVIEFTSGSTPGVELAGRGIWAIFVLDSAQNSWSRRSGLHISRGTATPRICVCQCAYGRRDDGRGSGDVRIRARRSGSGGDSRFRHGSMVDGDVIFIPAMEKTPPLMRQGRGSFIVER
jgi:hypothetical protein